MESWRMVWRKAITPIMSVPALEALKKGLEDDDPRIMQGAISKPPPLHCTQGWPVEAACALGYCGWAEIEMIANREQESTKPDGAQEIQLTQDKVAWVDADDYQSLSAFKWHAVEHHGRWYAYRTEYVGGKDYDQNNIPMHRQLMNTPEGMTVDHIDRNGLNNTRSNLRIATDAENKRNCRRSGKSIFRGVYPSPTEGRWCAKMSVNGKSVYLGTFNTEREAAGAYNTAVTESFGDRAVLNKFASVDEVADFFAQLCYEIDCRMGEPAACRYFLNWFDETEREEMRILLLAEVVRSIKVKNNGEQHVVCSPLPT